MVRRFAYHLGIASDKRASDILSERRERDQLKEGGARADLAGRTWRHLKRLISHYSQPPSSPPAEEDPGISPSSDKQWNVVMMRVLEGLSAGEGGRGTSIRQYQRYVL